MPAWKPKPRSKVAPPSAAQIAKMTYDDYLRTPHWRRVCKAHLRPLNQRCQRCGQVGRLTVVHLSLAAVGREGPDNVIALCESCQE